MRALAALPLLLLAACSSDPAPTDGGLDAAATDASRSDIAPTDAGAPTDTGPRVYPMPAVANAVPPTDPRWEGQYTWLYDSFGEELLDGYPPADFMLGLMQSEPAVFGNQFASFGFLPDANDEFPIGFKRGLVDRTRVHETCAVCHTSRLADGRLWFGAPATQLQIQRFIVEVDRRWVAAGHASHLGSGEEARLLAQGPGRIDADTGAAMTIPTDFPTYYALAQRPYLSILGTSRDLRAEAFLSVYGSGAGNPDDRTARTPFPSDDVLLPFIAFLGTFNAPAAPTGDAALVAQGRTLFASQHCDTCHHPNDVAMNGVTPFDAAGVGERYPGQDPAYPQGLVATDPLHFQLEAGSGSGGDAGFDPSLITFVQFIARHHLSVGPSNGYRVPDLRGLAHTAPYLHNGSVPTLDALLQPPAMRPSTWMRGTFPIDTTTPGNSNRGHNFGTTLSVSDRAALVAYLQSL